MQSLSLLSTLAVAAAFGLLGVALAAVRVVPASTLGRRGERRRCAQANAAFRAVEPVVRLLGALLAAMPLERISRHLDLELQRSSHFLGLGAHELLALSALGAAVGFVVGACAHASGAGAWVLFCCIGIGASLPFILMRDQRRMRTRSITRRLPAALDLLALALNAGLTFSAALDLVAASFVDRREPLCEELTFLQQDLATGSSRHQALLALAARSDAPSIHDLVRAVVQAERKGSPLATVLEVQAEVSRNRRGVLAEEAAARAGVLLLLPLMLLMVALLLVIVAPLLIQGLAS
jgi:tight adherence protein C